MELTESTYGKFFYYGSDCIGREVATGKFMSEWLHPQMDILGPGLTLIDVGASIGFFTIYAAKRGAKVYAFEPSTEVFDLLKRNVEVNGVSENVTLYPTLLAYHGDSYTDIANLLDELHYITPIYAGGVDYVSVPKEAA